MQHDSRLEVIQRGVREKICTICYQRPPGSEKLSHDTPRTCESGCTIFLNLHELSRIARHGENHKSDEHQVKECICQTCKVALTAGDFCLERLTRACPLSRYQLDVVSLIRKLNAADEIAAARRKAMKKV
jgi:Na+-translocating ferredoxin:NAD+ oxidoreductase RnfC subunit